MENSPGYIRGIILVLCPLWDSNRKVEMDKLQQLLQVLQSKQTLIKIRKGYVHWGTRIALTVATFVKALRTSTGISPNPHSSVEKSCSTSWGKRSFLDCHLWKKQYYGLESKWESTHQLTNKCDGNCELLLQFAFMEWVSPAFMISNFTVEDASIEKEGKV